MKVKNTSKNREILDAIFSTPPKKEFEPIPVGTKRSDLDKEPLKVKELKPNYYMFGNKGAVWNNEAHIAKSGEPYTLCETPMLSTNHCRLEGVEEIGCEECLAVYEKETERKEPMYYVEMRDMGQFYAYWSHLDDEPIGIKTLSSAHKYNAIGARLMIKGTNSEAWNSDYIDSIMGSDGQVLLADLSREDELKYLKSHE
jgi:hypothetical protein